MERVVIETPYGGPEIHTNTGYIRECMTDSIDRGEAPVASHFVYGSTGLTPEDSSRILGIELGFAWMEVCDKVVVYIDRGLSKGVKAAMLRALALGKPIEFRSLYWRSPELSAIYGRNENLEAMVNLWDKENS